MDLSASLWCLDACQGSSRRSSVAAAWLAGRCDLATAILAYRCSGKVPYRFDL